MLGRQSPSTGAALAIAGGVLTLVFNGIHPHPSDPAPEAFLLDVAAHPYWSTIHLGLILGVVLILGGLASLTDALREEDGASLSGLGFLSAQLGVAVFLVNFAIDGLAMQGIARAWVEAPPAERGAALRVAEALDAANFGLYTVETLLLPGLPFVLYGLAVTRSTSFPRWLGWPAVVGGSAAFLAGTLQAYSGRTPLASVLFVAGSMLVTAWMLPVGIVLWRRGLHQPASPAEPAQRVTMETPA